MALQHGPGLHAFNQRLLAEDLVRVRRPDDRERYARRSGRRESIEIIACLRRVAGSRERR